MYENSKEDIPRALLCNIYAFSLIYWSKSATIVHQRSPDVRYVWSLAGKALNDDLRSPGLPTVMAALLDIGGRPTTNIIGNAVHMGRTVSLAYSLGLNRNPESWVLPAHERSMRTRIWWSVLIHDWWYVCSFYTWRQKNM